MARVVDLRSDTLTMPTDEMYEALRQAPLGDDVFQEDPTVNRLQALAAEKLGKEAALLVTSGTQGNLLALLTHCPRGSEAIVGATSHIYNYEVGGLAALGGILPRVVPDPDGAPTPEDVAAAIRPKDVHAGPTALICLENTHNRAGGTAIPLDRLRAIAEVAQRQGLPVHLDGARVFNAAVALGVDVRAITQHVDSVTFCLSKGLSAPVGSVLCGSQAFIERARGIRKMLGAGMRQAGWIAAAGIVALNENVERLAEDHANARLLGALLRELPGLRLEPETVYTNMVFVDVTGTGLTPAEVGARLAEDGIRVDVFDDRRLRLVTHLGITREDVERTAAALARLVRTARA